MCIGGNDKATKRAEAAERERQQQVRAGRAGVDRAFTGREADYDTFADALRQHFMQQLDRSHDRNSRQLGFGLARGGLTGGSFQGDAGFNLAREYQDGVLDADRRVQGGVSDLRSADEATRLNMYSLVQGGADATTAAERAGAAMRANLGGVKSSTLADGLGNVFGGTADLYRRQQEADERRRGLRESKLYTNPFSREDG